MPSLTRSLLAACLAALAFGATPALATFPGQNGRIVFLSDRDGDDDIYTVNPDGSGLRNLTNDSAGADALATWSPDGRRIAFMSDRITPTNPTNPINPGLADFELYVMNADGSQVRQITFNSLDDEDPSWSPSGRGLVFSRDSAPRRGEVEQDIMLIRDDGRGERKLTNSPGVFDSQPSWSPDGSRIAFTSDFDGDNEIYTVDPRGHNARKLTRNAVEDTNGDPFDDADDDEFPNWSPDGRMITFNSNRDGKFEIYRMRSNGRDQTRLTVTTGDSGNAAPAWSPDGRLIVFNSDRLGSPDVFTMRATDGAGQVLRFGSDRFDFAPDWQPIGGAR